ncbi:hypothetical protein HanRHA438_Chr14g0653661 [Helianthus annuus]|nr:hypothetical protein HanRHA438_Chr14g0653661 [Helianthus annuus]
MSVFVKISVAGKNEDLNTNLAVKNVLSRHATAGSGTCRVTGPTSRPARALALLVAAHDHSFNYDFYCC